MAKTRNIDLDRKVLTKLMLLEYIRPDEFKEFVRWSQNNETDDNFISLLEQLASETCKGKKNKNSKESEAKVLGDFVSKWIDDKWLKDWLVLEPTFINIDLSQYLYFARDILEVNTLGVRRFSQTAQMFIQDILSQSDAIWKAACKRANTISNDDAIQVFNFMAEKVHSEEDFSEKSSPLGKIISFTEQRKELIHNLFSMIRSMPTKNLPIWLPQNIAKLYSQSETACMDLLKYFEEKGSKNLSTAAVRAMVSVNKKEN
jgi:hypothetical protein